MTMQENGLTTAQQQAIENLYRAFNEQNPDLLDLALTSDWQDIPLGPGQQPGRRACGRSSPCSLQPSRT
jgi:hypothetical protein